MTFNIVDYFRTLASRNKLCQQEGFRFGQCAGLQGLYDALANASTAPNFISVDDSSDGYISQDTGQLRTVRTVYLTMRHKTGDMAARSLCLDTMREIFRQFLTHFIRERVRLEEGNIEFDRAIQFSEIDSAFFTGAACAYFQIATVTPLQLCYNPDEWQ